MSKFTDSILCLVRAGHYEPSYTQPVTDYLDSDVLLVNQTANTLQNLCLDFATLGDLKLVERPTVYTIAPHSFQSIKATIKVRTTCKRCKINNLSYLSCQVSSTETGVIFGSILWEGPGMSEQCVILNDIHIDIMDYIKPAYCTEAQVCSSEAFIPGCPNNLSRSSEACGRSSSGRTGSTLLQICRTLVSSPVLFATQFFML